MAEAVGIYKEGSLGSSSRDIGRKRQGEAEEEVQGEKEAEEEVQGEGKKEEEEEERWTSHEI